MSAGNIASLAHLLRLVSPTLPVGAYSYSQGLERAIEDHIVHDEATAFIWIRDALHHVLASFEAPISLRLYRAWRLPDMECVHRWNHLFLTSREAAELHTETVQMGYSLKRLLNETTTLADSSITPDALDPCSFPAAFSYAALHVGVEEKDMLLGMLWAWAENQVMAALKSVPLGQAAGQRILCQLIEHLPNLVEQIVAMSDEDICNFAPAFAITCSLHETQYSRLFRS